MPNWCENRLKVSGPKGQVDAIVEAVKCDNPAATDLSLNKMVPMPDVMCMGEDEIQWACRNWGTKWDVDATSVRVDDETVVFRFDSAWSPPDAAVITFAERFPDVEFILTYAETAMGFGGQTTVKGTDVFEDEMDMEEAFYEMNGCYPDDEDEEEE